MVTVSRREYCASCGRETLHTVRLYVKDFSGGTARHPVRETICRVCDRKTVVKT